MQSLTLSRTNAKVWSLSDLSTGAEGLSTHRCQPSGTLSEIEPISFSNPQAQSLGLWKVCGLKGTLTLFAGLISTGDPQGHLPGCEPRCLHRFRLLIDTYLEAVYDAIKIGYRLLDGAGDYGNEKEAGEGVRRAIKEGIVKREDLCRPSFLVVGIRLSSNSLACSHYLQGSDVPHSAVPDQTLSQIDFQLWNTFHAHDHVSLPLDPSHTN
jgi:hypothetical protein